MDLAPMRLPGWPAVAIPAAVLPAWLVNSMHWVGDAGFMVAVCLASLVATAVLAVGWTSEPEAVERWALRAVGAALGSALPTLMPA
ncbi:MAG: hypothetical protein ACO1PB_21185 [Ramlibacter sp.]